MASRNNALGLGGKLAFYGHRVVDFLSGYPREANTEGGIFPAIFGTVVMVLIMSVLVTPVRRAGGDLSARIRPPGPGAPDHPGIGV